MGDLRQAIEAANRSAALGRQKAMGRKFAAIQTDGAMIDTLVEKITTVLMAHKANQPLTGPLADLAAAAKLAQKHREGRNGKK